MVKRPPLLLQVLLRHLGNHWRWFRFWWYDRTGQWYWGLRFYMNEVTQPWLNDFDGCQLTREGWETFMREVFERGEKP